MTKITFCKNEFNLYIDFWNRMPPSIGSVSLVDCPVQRWTDFVSWTRNKYWRSVVKKCTPVPPESATLEQQELANKRSPCLLPYSVEWHGWTGSMRLDKACDNNNSCIMLLAQKVLDDKGLIWPYPDEQLHWLLKSLNNLDAMLLEAVKDFDQDW